MKANMGSTDKAIRIVVALILAGLYFGHIVTGNMAPILLVLAAVFVLTSLISFCPLYVPFGISTKKKNQ